MRPLLMRPLGKGARGRRPLPPLPNPLPQPPYGGLGGVLEGRAGGQWSPGPPLNPAIKITPPLPALPDALCRSRRTGRHGGAGEAHCIWDRLTGSAGSACSGTAACSGGKWNAGVSVMARCLSLLFQFGQGRGQGGQGLLLLATAGLVIELGAAARADAPAGLGA